ncbi:MAG: hypothetical protein ACFFDB_09515 [Promethearchaeota archaeon]
MCKNCNCDFFDRCSIVGYMPVGFCCENCYLYDEYNTCLKSKSITKVEEKTDVLEKIKLVRASLEGELLKVVISLNDENEKTLFIDLKKHLQA